MVRLTWRQLQVPDPERPGCSYADLPRLRVDPASGRASSRAFMWPLGRRGEPSRYGAGGFIVALGVTAGPHPESRYFAETIQVAVDVVEALYEGRDLPGPTACAACARGDLDAHYEHVAKGKDVEPEPEEDLESQLARSLEERDEQREREGHD